jgi:hypothetical protein
MVLEAYSLRPNMWHIYIYPQAFHHDELILGSKSSSGGKKSSLWDQSGKKSSVTLQINLLWQANFHYQLSSGGLLPQHIKELISRT